MALRAGAAGRGRTESRTEFAARGGGMVAKMASCGAAAHLEDG